MARPQKDGLEYFPLDVDIDQDDKIALIEAEHGLVGFAIVIKLLMKIYKNSYFYEWTEKEQLLFSKRINVDINSVNVIINDCLKWEMFNQNLFDTYKILTSKGIQKRFLEASKRRQRIEMDNNYLLLDDDEVNVYKNIVVIRVNVTETTVNADINPQRKEKEKKRERKEKVKERESSENSQTLSLYVEKITCGKWFIAKEMDKLNVLIEMYTYDWVKDAVDNAALKKKYSVGYMEGILKNWTTEGKGESKPNGISESDLGEELRSQGIGL